MSRLGITDRLTQLLQQTTLPRAGADTPVKILFVEDLESDYDVMRFSLRQANFALSPETRRVEDEAGMRAALAEVQWDVVVSDYQLPRFTPELALALARATQPDIPFLIVSGAVGEDTAVKAMQSGADDYVMKHNLYRLPTAIENAIKAAGIRVERTRAVESLLASENYLRTLITASPISIIALDGSRKLTLLNAAAEKMFPQLPRFLGKIPDLASADAQALFDHIAATHAAGGSLTQHAAHWVQNDGTTSELVFSTAALTQGQNTGTVVFAVDVTELKNAEAARRESESRVTAISENLPGVLFRLVFHVDQGQTFVPYVSAGARELFGIAPEDFGADPARFMNLFDTSTQEDIRQAVSASLQSGHTLQGQWKIVRPDGSSRWIHLSASVRDESSGGRLFDGIITDVTALKNAELELSGSREELRQLTAHMEVLKEEERRAIAREIHDDIGSTLAGLKADAAWLKKRLSDDALSCEKLDDMSQLVDGAVQTANRIIQALRPGILDYGIGPALEWQAKEFAARMGIDVQFESNQEDVSVDLEQSAALFRVFQEALTNISKYAGATEVKTVLFATPTSITLEIRDNGCGLADGDLAKASSFGIRGMMERARSLDGWIDISGRSGHGTTVMLSIPRNRPNPAPRSAPA